MRVVAFGGGHGLSASLRALRLLRPNSTWTSPPWLRSATTAGPAAGCGPSGGLPPGDLRQALSALADPTDPVAPRSADLIQYRFAGDDAAGRPRGRQPAAGRADGAYRRPGGRPGSGRATWSARSAGCCRCRRQPLGIEATVRGDDPSRPDRVMTVRGQHAIAVSRGVVEDVRLTPADRGGLRRGGRRGRVSRLAGLRPGIVVHQCDPAPACPGSCRRHRVQSSPPTGYAQPRRRVGDGRAFAAGPSSGAGPLPARPASRCSSSRWESGGRPIGLQSAAESLRARVVFAPVAVADGGPRHDPAALASALYEVLRTASRRIGRARTGSTPGRYQKTDREVPIATRGV